MADTLPYTEQTISAATGLVTPRIDVCFIQYTATGVVSDIELDSNWIKGHSHTTFIDVDGCAGRNNITIKKTDNTVVAVLTEDKQSMLLVSDGTNIFIVFS